MYTVKDIYDFIDEIAPFSYQEDYDNSGLNVGDMRCPVSGVMVTLDCVKDTIGQAMGSGMQLIVSHHPVIFHPVKQLDPLSMAGALLKRDMNLIAAHTNFDSTLMNKLLCKILDLTPTDCITEKNGVQMGCICDGEHIARDELLDRLHDRLGCHAIDFTDTTAETYKKKIAVCAGSGGSLLEDAIAKGCDCFITGDVKHDRFIEAIDKHIMLVDAGHYYTEKHFSQYMCELLRSRFPGLEVEEYQSDGSDLNFSINESIARRLFR